MAYGNNVGQAYLDFTNLELWRKARELKNNIFLLTKRFPFDERFRLADQLIRASRSICASIAEGHGRYTFKDQIHFCIISRGSLSEVKNHIIDARDCEYILENEFIQFQDNIAEILRLL